MSTDSAALIAQLGTAPPRNRRQPPTFSDCEYARVTVGRPPGKPSEAAGATLSTDPGSSLVRVAIPPQRQAFPMGHRMDLGFHRAPRCRVPAIRGLRFADIPTRTLAPGVGSDDVRRLLSD